MVLYKHIITRGMRKAISEAINFRQAETLHSESTRFSFIRYKPNLIRKLQISEGISEKSANSSISRAIGIKLIFEFAI